MDRSGRDKERDAGAGKGRFRTKGAGLEAGVIYGTS
jgi:hypothetical protein